MTTVRSNKMAKGTIVAAVVLVMTLSYLSVTGSAPALAGLPGLGSAPHVVEVPGAATAYPASPSSGLSVAASPNGSCGIATWCKPITASGDFFSTSVAATPGTTSACLVGLVAGACKSATGATSSVTPYLNTTDDVATNLTSTGVLAMAYTNYTTVAPTGAPTCTPARPAVSSEVTFVTSMNLGATWSSPTQIGTSDCASAQNYPDAYDPALTSLSDGTIVLAYVEYAPSGSSLPPNINPVSPPLSRLVVTELASGSTTWTTPTVVNVSNPDPSLTVSFAPVRPSLAAYGNTIYLAWMNVANPTNPLVISHAVFVTSSNGGSTWSPTITLGPGNVNSSNPDVLVSPTTGELFIAYDTDVYYCVADSCGAPKEDGMPYSASVVVAYSVSSGTSFSTTNVMEGVLANTSFGIFYNPAPQLSWSSATKPTLNVAFVGGYPETADIGGVVVPDGAVGSTLYFATSGITPVSGTTGGSVFFTVESASETALFNPNNLWGGLQNSTTVLDIGLARNFHLNDLLEATIYNGSACIDDHCGVVMTVALNTSNNGTSWSSPWIISGSVMPNGTAGGAGAFWVGDHESVLDLGGSGLYLWVGTSCPSWNPAKPSLGAQCGTHTAASGSPTWTLPGTSSVMVSVPYTGPAVSENFTASQSAPANATWGIDVMGLYVQTNGATNITITNIPSGLPILFNGSQPGPWRGGYYYFNDTVTSVASPETYTTSFTPVTSVTFTEYVQTEIHESPTFLDGTNPYASYDGTSPQFAAPPGPGPSYGYWTNSSNSPTQYADGFGTFGWSGWNPYDCIFQTCYEVPGYAGIPEPINSTTCTAYQYGEVDIFGTTEWEAFMESFGDGCSNAYLEHTVSPTNPTNVANLTANTPIWIRPGTSYTIAPAYWSPFNYLCNVNLGMPFPPGVTSSAYPAFLYLWVYCGDVAFVELQPLAWLGNGTGSVTSTAQTITIDPTSPVNETVAWDLTNVCTAEEIYGYEEIVSGTTYQGNYNASTTCVNPANISLGGGGGLPLPVTVSETGLPTGTEWGVNLVGSTNTSSFTTTDSSKTLSIQEGLNFTVEPLTIPIGKTGQYWIGTPNTPTLATPDFAGVVVSYVIGSLSGFSFAGTVSVSGLPNGFTGAWSLNITDDTSGVASTTNFPPGPTSTSPYHFTAKGGEVYSFNGSTIYTSTGARYTVTAVNVTVNSINGTSQAEPPNKAATTAAGSLSVSLIYSPAFYVTVETGTGGTVNNQSGYIAEGHPDTLTATPDTGYLFVGWVGSGNGSVSSKDLTIAPHPGNPLTEFAVFRPIPAPTWTVTVDEIGLPVTQNYSLSLGGQTYSGEGTFAITNITTGDYTFTAPSVFNTPDNNIQYVPTIDASAFPSAGGQAVSIAQSGTVKVTYATEYELTWSNTTGGTVSGAPNGDWLSLGTTIDLTAEPAPGYHFVSWNGTGSGSYTGTDAVAPVTPEGPITEMAQFLLNPPPPVFHYSLTVSESGLPTGTTWNATVGLVGGSSVSGTIVLNGLNGTYTLTVPVVQGASGVRYVPDSKTTAFTSSETLDQNVSASVTFVEQYLVTIESSGGGSTSESTSWVDAGSAFSVTATPNTTAVVGTPPWEFASWNASGGIANATTATYTLAAVNGPVTLTATFVPAYTQTTQVVQFEGAPIAIGLLVVLLIVGLVVGMLIARMRGSGGSGKPKARIETRKSGGQPKAAGGPSTAPSALPPAPASGAANGDDSADWSELNESPPSS